MPRYFTMPFGDAGVWEGDVYKGNAATAASLFVTRYADKDSSEEAHHHVPTGKFLEEGWRFGRRMTEQDPATGAPTKWEGEGTEQEWKPLHAQGEPTREQEKLLVKMDFEVQASPGNNMKDPDGFLIWFQGGTVAQPATGEQSRDKWTGELLWLNSPTNTIPQLEP